MIIFIAPQRLASRMKQAAFRIVCALGVIALASVGASAVEFRTSPQPLVIETANGPVSFTVELATTSEERSQGLMNREEMADDHGMIFDFGATRPVMMWMKNTILPLDMVFLAPDGEVLGVAAEAVPFSETIISSPGPVRYVLEINAGLAAEKGIAAGDKVVHPAVGAE
jgi:uncharacterized protein